MVAVLMTIPFSPFLWIVKQCLDVEGGRPKWGSCMEGCCFNNRFIRTWNKQDFNIQYHNVLSTINSFSTSTASAENNQQQQQHQPLNDNDFFIISRTICIIIILILILIGNPAPGRTEALCHSCSNSGVRETRGWGSPFHSWCGCLIDWQSIFEMEFSFL